VTFSTVIPCSVEGRKQHRGGHMMPAPSVLKSVGFGVRILRLHREVATTKAGKRSIGPMK